MQKKSVLNRISHQFFLTQSNQHLHIEQCVAMDCRKSGTSVVNAIKQLCRKTSDLAAPVGITLEASILLGLLEKDFSTVVTCTIHKVIEYIKKNWNPTPNEPVITLSSYQGTA